MLMLIKTYLILKQFKATAVWAVYHLKSNYMLTHDSNLELIKSFYFFE